MKYIQEKKVKVESVQVSVPAIISRKKVKVEYLQEKKVKVKYVQVSVPAIIYSLAETFFSSHLIAVIGKLDLNLIVLTFLSQQIKHELG